MGFAGLMNMSAAVLYEALQEDKHPGVKHIK
jgi:hypothetical protein